jgi:hypothetical protein
MNAVMQQGLVAVLVVAAALFAAWRLAPDATRLRMLVWLLRHVSAEGAVGSMLRTRIAALTASGCANCSSNATGSRKKI